MRRAPVACLALLLSPVAGHTDDRLDVIKNPYGGSRNVPELSTDPDYIHTVIQSGP